MLKRDIYLSRLDGIMESEMWAILPWGSLELKSSFHFGEKS